MTKKEKLIMQSAIHIKVYAKAYLPISLTFAHWKTIHTKSKQGCANPKKIITGTRFQQKNDINQSQLP